jgi:hypothetical protein
MRKQNAVLTIAIVLVLAAPSVALAYKKNASSSSERLHFSYSETSWSHTQQRSNSATVQRAALTFGTVGKSAGYK